MANICRLHWDATKGVEVESLQGLDNTIDRLQKEAAQSRPILVEVIRSTGDVLIIGLGLENAVLNYTPATKNPPYYVSVREGAETTEDTVVYYFFGAHTEFPSRFLIPMQQARLALRHFVETGHLAKEINWEQV